MLPGIVDVDRGGPPSTSRVPPRLADRERAFDVEHVGGASGADELLAFWWSPRHDWQLVMFSAKTVQHVGAADRLAGARRPVSGRAPRRANAGRRSDGLLVVAAA